MKGDRHLRCAAEPVPVDRPKVRMIRPWIPRRPALLGEARSATMARSISPKPDDPGKVPAMPQTNSRKANQRRRFQKQRGEVRKRLQELKAAAPRPAAEAKS